MWNFGRRSKNSAVRKSFGIKKLQRTVGTGLAPVRNKLHTNHISGQAQGLSLRYNIIFNPCEAPAIFHFSFFTIIYYLAPVLICYIYHCGQTQKSHRYSLRTPMALIIYSIKLLCFLFSARQKRNAENHT